MTHTRPPLSLTESPVHTSLPNPCSVSFGRFNRIVLSPDRSHALVHPIESSLHDFSKPCSERLKPHRVFSSAFFHREHWRKRQSVLNAMGRVGFPIRVMERYEQCGRESWIVENENKAGHYAVRKNGCRHRFCESCADQRRLRIVKNLTAHTGKARVRLPTLTLKAVATPLRSQIGRLIDSWRKMSRVPSIKLLLRGGATVMELTINPVTGLWHPHLHVIFHGLYLPQPLVRKHWHRITGDSFICDVRCGRKHEARHLIRGEVRREADS